MDITSLREDYCQSGLNRNDLSDTPIDQFHKWFEEAQLARFGEPNAMILSTVSEDGLPSSRTVLLKIYDEKGFIFFTNYNSQKSQDIKQNPNVALLFPWLPLERQVRITGSVEKIPKSESFAYFTSRPKGSQIGAWISPQSKVIESRGYLKKKLTEMEEKFSNGDIPLPSDWGGYRVVPTKFEFWQGRTSRLHDRFTYQKILNSDNNWIINRLAP